MQLDHGQRVQLAISEKLTAGNRNLLTGDFAPRHPCKPSDCGLSVRDLKALI